MNPTWAAHISKCHLFALGRLRLIPGIEILEQGEKWWLRGASLSEGLLLKLRTLSEGELFHVLDDGQLVPIDQKVPRGMLPQGTWRSIQEAIPPTLPVTRFAGKVQEQVPLELVRAFIEQTANVLVVPFGQLFNWGITAPKVRLKSLRFATRLDGTTVVHGHPLPSIQGQYYVEQNGIAIAAGWNYSPALPISMLADRWRLRRGDLCLWDSDGRQLIEADQFVACGRSAFKATEDALAGGADVST